MIRKSLLVPAMSAMLLLISAPVFSQGPAPPPPNNEVPLDGFSLLLLAAGAGYGAKRVLRSNSKADASIDS